MKTTLNALLARLPLIGRLIRVIDAHDAEIKRLRNTFSAEINHMRDTFGADINLIRETYGAELKYLREEFSTHSAAMSTFSIVLTESVAMRTTAQMVESERLSSLYESLALRLAALDAAQSERVSQATLSDVPSRENV